MKYNIVVMENFGKWLKRHRLALEMNQKDVAKLAEISVSYVSTLERSQPHSLTGESIRPEPEVVAALAKAVKGNLAEAMAFFGYATEKRDKFFFSDSVNERGEITLTNGIYLRFDESVFDLPVRRLVTAAVQGYVEGILAGIEAGIREAESANKRLQLNTNLPKNGSLTERVQDSMTSLQNFFSPNETEKDNVVPFLKSADYHDYQEGSTHFKADDEPEIVNIGTDPPDGEDDPFLDEYIEKHLKGKVEPDDD
jgi:transcriptional regulator with XRE-family HTH domain